MYNLQITDDEGNLYLDNLIRHVKRDYGPEGGIVLLDSSSIFSGIINEGGRESSTIKAVEILRNEKAIAVPYFIFQEVYNVVKRDRRRVLFDNWMDKYCDIKLTDTPYDWIRKGIERNKFNLDRIKVNAPKEYWELIDEYSNEVVYKKGLPSKRDIALVCLGLDIAHEGIETIILSEDKHHRGISKRVNNIAKLNGYSCPLKIHKAYHISTEQSNRHFHYDSKNN